MLRSRSNWNRRGYDDNYPQNRNPTGSIVLLNSTLYLHYNIQTNRPKKLVLNPRQKQTTTMITLDHINKI